MKHYYFTFLTGVGLLLGGALAVSDPRRPNIIILQSDDQGYDDVGFTGNKIIQTPAMDAIAREGVTFPQFYTHETCAPTRSSLLTGRHFLDAGVWGVHGGRDYLNSEETTFGDVFRFHGYQTALFGKWHTGKTPGYLPWDRGFNEAWMFDLYQYYDNVMVHNGKPVPTHGWAAAVATDKALEFIDQNSDRPFLLYVPYMEPHEGNGPSDPNYSWQAPEEYVEPYRRMGLSPAMARLYGMISHIDFQMSRILKKVAEKNLDEQTIIIFLSDNGPIGSSSYPSASDWTQRNRSQLHGNKGTVYENGIRIPFAIRWKNHIKPQQLDHVAIVQDIFPSIMELAGLKVDSLSKKLEGISFARQVQGHGNFPTQRPLFFSVRAPYHLSSRDDKEFYPIPDRGLDRSRMTLESTQSAMRKGPWKLVSDTGSYQLFNLEKDPQERDPVNNREVMEAMKQELATWWQQRVSSTETFNPPRFQIGRHTAPYATVFMYSAISTQGGVKLFTVDTQGWKGSGDSVSVQVEVKRQGLYQVYINSSEIPAGLRVRLQVGDTIVEGEAQKLPAMALDFGKKDLILSIVEAPSGTFSKLQSLDFSLIREDQRYPSCENFQGGFGATFSCGTSSCKKVNSEWHRNSGEEFWCRA